MTTNTEGAALPFKLPLVIKTSPYASRMYVWDADQQFIADLDVQHAEAIVAALNATLTRAPSSQPQEWRPIETRPTDGAVILFCDVHGNRWTDCSSHIQPYPECGYYPTHWQPLPPPPVAAQSAERCAICGEHANEHGAIGHPFKLTADEWRELDGVNLPAQPDCAPPPSPAIPTCFDIANANATAQVGSYAGALKMAERIRASRGPSPASEPAAGKTTVKRCSDCGAEMREYLGPPGTVASLYCPNNDCPSLGPSSEKGEAETREVGEAHGPWLCFHCGETCETEESAREHFGDDQGSTPACKLSQDVLGLVCLLREQDRELRAYRQEDTASHREFYALGATHQTELRREEERGYSRGLEDAKKHPETLGLRASPAACEGRGSVTAEELEAIQCAAFAQDSWASDLSDHGYNARDQRRHAKTLRSLATRLTPAVAKEGA